MWLSVTHLLPFHIQIKSSLLWKTLHRLHTYFTMPFQCDSLSNLMKPSDLLIWVMMLIMWQYIQKGNFCVKIWKSKTKDSFIFWHCYHSSIWEVNLLSSEICGDASSALGVMTTFVSPLRCTLPSELQDATEKLTAIRSYKDGKNNKNAFTENMHLSIIP